ncbi:gamma-glutamyl-gamma-aminobutyrate hydrolase family protein [Legionella quateirensis]|uniref:Glutamine amidotransferase n=1 Tax=Legionella quateirensis TaxID=45072 RepID=A0A378KUT1_9GAMM|nr:gamma-glutamyl-gamma-aminobutyrate hydrolase family protein [Legionella quateirensis]KTD43227.1 glutamine amidotransferase [Legionella quateirensis]STY18106.1 glutamine amidotransferase [Legionella quateirensis]
MPKVAVTFSPIVGGSSVVSLKKAFKHVGSTVVDADFRMMLEDIPEEKFQQLYKDPQGRQLLFAHAKARAAEILEDVDCLALSGNNAMIDPELFNKERQEGQPYDFSRTVAELALVHVAIQKGMPILGVCGGHQVIAVYGGGEIADLNSTQLDKQCYMNYDAIRINKDTMAAQIFGGKNHLDDVSSTHYEGNFFGAHSQIISRLPKGFIESAIASDNQSNEAIENINGVPIITTQFHPEIGAKGLPEAKFVYRRTQHDIETNLRMFEFMHGAALKYKQQKKGMLAELRQFTPVIDDELIKPSEVKSQMEELLKHKQETDHDPVLKKNQKSLFHWSAPLGLALLGSAVIATVLFIIFPPAGLAAAVGLGSAIVLGAAVGTIALTAADWVEKTTYDIIDAISALVASGFRAIISMGITKLLVNQLKEKEQLNANADVDSAEQNTTESSQLHGSSASRLLSSAPDVPNREIQTPADILRDTPAKLWTDTNTEVHQVLEVVDSSESNKSEIDDDQTLENRSEPRSSIS